MVPGPEQQMLTPVRQREEPCDRTVGEARSVHPARDRVDCNVLADAVRVIIGTERRRTEIRIVRQPVVGEPELRDEVRHAEVAEMLRNRIANQCSVVAIDRLGTGKARILEVGTTRQDIAPVVIEADHDLISNWLARRLSSTPPG